MLLLRGPARIRQWQIGAGGRGGRGAAPRVRWLDQASGEELLIWTRVVGARFQTNALNPNQIPAALPCCLLARGDIHGDAVTGDTGSFPKSLH